MDKIIGKELLEIVGRENISAAYEDRICYAYDATFKDSLPDVIVKPGTTEEVAKILKLANQYKIPVTPRGAGTGLSGGSVPINGGISLVLTRLNKILKIDVQNRSALVEPGVITEDLQTAVEEKGLLYPPDPASKKISTLGGNVAEGAGGPRGVKYGVTKDYVLGLEVVLPQGDIIKINNSVDGETEDFDYTMLFTASEGTLGIITKIAVKLILPPQYQETVLAAFDNLEHAGETVSAIIRAGIIPTTLEIIDQETIRAVENYLHTGLPTDAAALLLIEVDGAELEVKRQSAEVAKICNLASRNVKVASTKQEIDKLWQARRSISGACGMLKPTKLSEDATVPRSKIPQMIKEIRHIAEKYNIKIVIFGHAGDGNLHPNILTDKRDENEMHRVEQAISELFQATVNLGGTLSGEHGIGFMKAPYLKWETEEVGYTVLKKIKNYFDPNNILNPGKMFGD